MPGRVHPACRRNCALDCASILPRNPFLAPRSGEVKAAECVCRTFKGQEVVSNSVHMRHGDRLTNTLAEVGSQKEKTTHEGGQAKHSRDSVFLLWGKHVSHVVLFCSRWSSFHRCQTRMRWCAVHFALSRSCRVHCGRLLHWLVSCSYGGKRFLTPVVEMKAACSLISSPSEITRHSILNDVAKISEQVLDDACSEIVFLNTCVATVSRRAGRRLQAPSRRFFPCFRSMTPHSNSRHQRGQKSSGVVSGTHQSILGAPD